MSVTLLIIAITCTVSFLAFRNGRLLDELLLWPPAISRRHEYYRLVTYGLVHADFNHLLFNMLTLYFFGRAMEDFYAARLGAAGFVLFYVGALVVSILPSWRRHRGDANYRSLGASGAVSAALFAFILLAPWSTLLVFVIPMPAIVFALIYVGYSVWMERRGTGNVNHGAHLWGAGYGVLFTVLLEPGVVPHFLDALLHPAFGR